MEKQEQTLETTQKTARKGRTISLQAKMSIACAACLVLGAVLGLVVFRVMLGADDLALLQAQRLVADQFVGEYDPKAHREAVLEATVDSLGDRWSYYLTPEEYRQVLDTRRNSYVGIGITVSREEGDGLRILAVTKGGPAEEAGLQPGDIVRSVAGTEVTQESREGCVDQIKGEEGTVITLEIEGADGTLRTVDVTRALVQGISAEWTMLEGDIGLITIQNFYTGTAGLVRQGVEELTAQHAKALVLDVRNNPGGYVTELTAILDLLLPEGDVFISHSSSGKETVYTSDAACIDLPMAVLVNGQSYSAAEFLAAQLRESAGAVVAGEQTSGKGYSQMLYQLADGSAIGLSTAKYVTGGGVSLVGTGLKPDPTVILAQSDQERLWLGQLPPEEDLQLQAAIRAMDLDE